MSNQTPDPNQDPKAFKAIQQAMSLSPDEQAAAKRLFGPKKLTREKIEERIMQEFGIPADELKIMHPKDEDLLKFYIEHVTKLKEMTLPLIEGDEPEPVDNYALTEMNQLGVDELKLQAKRREMRKVHQLKQAAAGVAQPISKQEVQEKFDAASAHLPKEDRVDFDDFLKSLQEGLGGEESSDEKN